MGVHRPGLRGRKPSPARQLGAAKVLSLAVCIGLGLGFAIANLRSWQLEDADAYWNAAMRLRAGAALYPVLTDPNAADVYRYAPWFAWAWVPLTYLPKGLVQAGWSALLVVGSVAALWPLLRVRSIAVLCLVALLGGLMLRTASTGNVQPLVVAALVHGLHRRSAPVWIGITTSLKLVPILFVVTYLGRRQWGSALVALGVSAALLAPTLLFDLRDYPLDLSDSASMLPFGGPVPYLILAAAGAIVAFALARTRYARAGASVAVLAAVPRLQFYHLTYLLAGTTTDPANG